MPALERACEASGRWLQHFQRITAAPRQTPGTSEDLLERMRADLDACLEMGLSEMEAGRMLAFCAAHLTAADAERLPAVGVHPDFQPDNVLVAPDRITVIDFPSFQYGHAASDVARFLVTLEFFSRTPLYARGRLDALRDAFVRGYGPWPPENAAILSAYLVRCFARVAASARAHAHRFPVAALARWRVVAFLSSWERRLAAIRAASLRG